MLEPEEIFSIINKDKGSAIVTSGGTHENIDDVKVISNLSSRKQGRSIAFEPASKRLRCYLPSCKYN